MEKEEFKKELLALLLKYCIIKQEGSVEINIKTNGIGIQNVRINDITNI